MFNKTLSESLSKMKKTLAEAFQEIDNNNNIQFKKTFYESLCEVKTLYWKGFKKYPKDDWFDRGVDDHFDHVIEHLKSANRTHKSIMKTDSLHKKERKNKIIVGNLVHAALRILMIIQIKILS
tara:strand:- start:978 stop:1346 length:369 start_codon:yes stop_codon:yes gene_type:complete